MPYHADMLAMEQDLTAKVHNVFVAHAQGDDTFKAELGKLQTAVTELQTKANDDALPNKDNDPVAEPKKATPEEKLAEVQEQNVAQMKKKSPDTAEAEAKAVEDHKEQHPAKKAAKDHK